MAQRPKTAISRRDGARRNRGPSGCIHLNKARMPSTRPSGRGKAFMTRAGGCDDLPVSPATARLHLLRCAFKFASSATHIPSVHCLLDREFSAACGCVLPAIAALRFIDGRQQRWRCRVVQVPDVATDVRATPPAHSRGGVERYRPLAKQRGSPRPHGGSGRPLVSGANQIVIAPTI